MTNKNKIINDPVYGFIPLQDDSLFDIVSHPFFQRLRRISQLGLSSLVYPGATHNRFQHSIGAMHLMHTALENLKEKGIKISSEECLAAKQAILMHDLGHAPFSHTLEYSLMPNISHEHISLQMMKHIGKDIGADFDVCIAIINDTYPKHFLHQLVSSQLDMDRLDYLKRDSYYTGVSEGVLGTDRLIQMLNVVNDHIVIEEKGIYSVEKFLVARRLMYWQVYLHKTVVAAEQMLRNILQLAKKIWHYHDIGQAYINPALGYFMDKDRDYTDHLFLSNYAHLDDYDIFHALKIWANCSYKALSVLSQQLLDRQLPKTEIQNRPFSSERIEKLKQQTINLFKINKADTDCFVFTDQATNMAYNQDINNIFIKEKGSENLIDIAVASDNLNIQSLSAPVKKYFLCYPKEIQP